jgi:hypothetical protein
VRNPQFIAITRVLAGICFAAFAIYGVLDLVDGDTVTGVALLVCFAVGMPSFVWWVRRSSSA